MTLRLHSRWIDRMGLVWKVTKHDPTYAYPFEAISAKTGVVQSFTADGRWTNLRETGYDLVEEVK